jgi:hypothetical protein
LPLVMTLYSKRAINFACNRQSIPQAGALAETILAPRGAHGAQITKANLQRPKNSAIWKFSFFAIRFRFGIWRLGFSAGP